VRAPVRGDSRAPGALTTIGKGALVRQLAAHQIHRVDPCPLLPSADPNRLRPAKGAVL